MAQGSLFRPTTTETPTGASLDSTGWNVTVPRSSEIVKPSAQLLEQLLPVKQAPVGISTAQLFEELFAAMRPSTASLSPPTSYAEALKRNYNRARTQNGAEAYTILDVFSGLNANSSTHDIYKQLNACWQRSPELTLRVIWNMRSVHEGHSNKIGFYHAFGWLYKRHPRTAIENLRFVVERLCERTIKHKPKKHEGGFEIVDPEEAPTEEVIKMPHGYYKDLLNIVVLAMRNELGNPAIEKFNSLNVPLLKRKTRTKAKWASIKKTKQHQNRKYGVEEAQKLREEASRKVDVARAEKAKADRRAKRQTNFATLKSKLECDKSFLALYATVAHIFADALAKDIGESITLAADNFTVANYFTALLKRIEIAPEEEAFKLQFELTSASKWAPTLEGFHDRATNISTAIALVMHAQGHMADLPLSLSGELTQENAHTLRSYYRRWIVSPLRRFAEVTEVKMSAGDWDKIDYRRVPSKCMKTNKGHFFLHDEERLTAYLEDVALGKSKISGATLLPHELLIEALKMRVPEDRGNKQTPEAAVKAEITRRLSESNKRVLEAQWNSHLERMRESGALESSLALVDVSGSMGWINCFPPKNSPHISPIFPAMALGILLAQLASPPFKDMFITFSKTPELLTLQPGGLAEQARWMDTTNSGTNTDYEAVFLKLLLPTAIENQVKPEDMIKRLFVFSDMQFDASLVDHSCKGWETTHDRIVKAYKEAGYEVPEIVYWNLQGGTTKPVLKDTPGTVLLTGFSANMMKLFMEGEDVEDEFTEIGTDGEEVQKKANTPLEVMKKALCKACYDTLKVYD
ncbi:hypothetical protein FRC06_001404 [Ceratobasidium sp. 370]|nr:hypothetical protein FRC06_001404 [Ceratobasidium sp. 370]